MWNRGVDIWYTGFIVSMSAIPSEVSEQVIAAYHALRDVFEGEVGRYRREVRRLIAGSRQETIDNIKKKIDAYEV